MEDPNAPATKGDIAEVKPQMEFRLEMRRVHDALVERIGLWETRVSNAFRSYTESNKRRLARTEDDQPATRDRLESIEARLLEVEKRLNIPPAA